MRGQLSQALKITPIMLASPKMFDRADEHRPSWMMLGYDRHASNEDGGPESVLFLSEEFARTTIPPAAIEEMRDGPCFYVWVANIAAALASVAGRVIGDPVEGFGMRGVCVATPQGRMILAERIAPSTVRPSL